MLASLLGLGATPAASQSLAPQAAPKAWVAYAHAASGTIAAWLEEDSEDASAFRRGFDEKWPLDSGSGPPLILKVWIEPDGLVSRLESSPAISEAAHVALQGAVVGRKLSSRPPAGLLSPLRLELQIKPMGDDRPPG